MSVALIEQALDVLGPLADEVVFVGGATIPLHVVEDGGTNFRPTIDVDVVIEAAARHEYEAFAQQLRTRGLSEDSTSRVICRWRHAESDLILDVMPDAERVFGFGNRWYPQVMRSPVRSLVPSGRMVRHSSAGALIAMKLEAYADRGVRDPLISHDLEDIVRIFDSRPSIAEDIAHEPLEMRTFIARALQSILDDPRSRDAIATLMLPDAASSLRARDVVVPRMRLVVSE